MACNETISYAVGSHGGVVHWIIVATSCVLGAMAIVGNIMVLFAVYSSENLKTISNYFLCSLAAADLWVGCFHTPFYTTLMALDTPSEGFILKFDFFIWLHILFTSTLSLCAISVDRYIAVKWPLKYIRLVTIKPCIFIIAMIWTIATFFAFPAVFIINLKAWSGYIAACSLLTLFVPLLTVTVCYIEIVKISRSQTTKVENFNKIDIQQRKNHTKNKKAVTTFAIVTIVFVVAFTPNFVFALWFFFTTTCEGEYDVFKRWTVSLFVMFSSSSANPLIYGFRNKEFKAAFKKMIFNPFRYLEEIRVTSITRVDERNPDELSALG